MKLLSKKIGIFAFTILLIMIFISFIYFPSIEPYDELWNFQNVFKMFNGYKIYSDANVIITPIFYFVSLIFLKIFGATIISFRILNLIIYSIFFFLLYKLFKILKISKHLSVLFLSIIFTQSFQVISCGANYSILTFVFVLLGIISCLTLFNKKYFNYLQGFIIFLIFFTKQNIGVFYALGILFYEFIYRTNLKEFIFNQLKKIPTFIIPITLSLYIFYINGILFDFISYAFGGILSFGNSNLSFAVSIYLVIICIFTITLYFYCIFNKKLFNNNILNAEKRKNLNLLACITIPITLSVYPILNTAHFVFIIPFYFTLLFYFFDFAILEDLFDSDKSKKLSYSMSLIILICILIRLLVFRFVQNSDFEIVKDNLSPYNNLTISTENYEKINTMTDYINQKQQTRKDVIIISFDSDYTMVNLKKNNKDFDLVFNGNLGFNGENKMIEKIKNSNNTEFLILTNEEDCFWQESKIIRKYIVENLNKTGEILNYSIYELK